jgi:hypothetical protein
MVEMGDRSPDRLNKSQREGISITKVSRGEPRCTFPNDWLCLRLLSLAIAQVEDFTVDTFISLAQTTDLGT